MRGCPGTGRCGHGILLPTSIERRAGNTEGPTCRRRSQPGGEFLGRLHQPFSSSSGLFRGIPSNVETFFGFRSPSRLAPASARATASPVPVGQSAYPSDPSVRASLPSRPARPNRVAAARRSGSTNTRPPTSPGFVHLSASRTIRRLYAAVNRRRVVLSATSGSGASPFRSPASRATPVPLRAPSVPRDSSFSCSDFVTNTAYLPSRPAH